MKITYETINVNELKPETLDYLLRHLTVRTDKYGLRYWIEVGNPKRQTAFVAYHGDKPVGWALLDRSKRCYLGVYVAVAQRGRGIGSDLVEFAMDYAKEHKRNVVVFALKRSAKFYEKVAVATGNAGRMFWNPYYSTAKPIPMG